MVKTIDNSVDQYIADLFAPEDEALAWIQAEADANGLPAINIRADEGRLLQMLLHALNARKIIEIGALAGYSGVWLARALPVGGKLYSLEVSSKHAAVVRAAFEHANLTDRAEVMEGDALDSLRKLAPHGPFDFVFIDADKERNPDYLAWSIENLRVGGMVAIHNALRNGGVLNPENAMDKAVAEFNKQLAADKRLESTIIAVGDGLAVGIKR